MWRQTIAGLAMGAAVLAVAPAARAQDNSFTINVGAFVPRGDDARVDGDVLNTERCINTTGSCEPLLFDIKDFNGGTVSGEWNIGLGEFFEVGAGVGFYQRTVPSVYAFRTFDDGSEIEQDLKLRVIPITATVKFVPTGRRSAVQPYIGGGVGIFPWHFSESGDFVDVDDTVFPALYKASGTAVGPVAFGGIRFPLGQSFLLGGEVRYQKAEGKLNTDFVSDKIDLSGFTYQATMTFRF
jgi:hypothetical protein